MFWTFLAGAAFFIGTAQLAAASAAATFHDVYGWVYRTGKEVAMNGPAAACLGLKAPRNLYERTWLAPDARVHAVEVGEDKADPLVLISVRHDLRSDYSGAFFLSGKDGRLRGVCNSPFVNASFVAVKDGSLDAAFESEKTYFMKKYTERGRWDRYVPVERNYP